MPPDTTTGPGMVGRLGRAWGNDTPDDNIPGYNNIAGYDNIPGYDKIPGYDNRSRMVGRLGRAWAPRSIGMVRQSPVATPASSPRKFRVPRGRVVGSGTGRY
jgi:hypothetical protein